jgi:hypothetical protein
MGRLKAIGSGRQLRGHVVRARTEELVLDSSTTDSAGRFLLRWGAIGDGKTAIELLGANGDVVESMELTAAELVSPPVVGLSGRSVVGSNGVDEEKDPENFFVADGDYPLCVTSSCIEVTLSWTAPTGSRVSIISEGETLREGLPSRGSLRVVENTIKKYTRRAQLPGAQLGEFSDRTVEVRRYPSLSLVAEGTTFRRGISLDLGVSVSCPAGDGGLKVTVLTSDHDVVPRSEFTIPAGLTWATTKIRLGEKAGRADVTAAAPGYVRDGVTFVVG